MSTTEQNKRYWAILTDTSEQVMIEQDGVKLPINYSPETWHLYFKAKFLGKDTIIVDGEPFLIEKTSTKMNVSEFGDYMTQIEAWAVEHGVIFRCDRF